MTASSSNSAREAATDRPIVSGGRYDGLITRLSGGTRRPAPSAQRCGLTGWVGAGAT
jgi:histidyl-tRNA synthetase